MPGEKVLREVRPQSLSVERLGAGKPGRQEPQLEMFGAVQDWRGAASMEWEGEDKEGDWLLAD